jgi:hypothetical protein
MSLELRTGEEVVGGTQWYLWTSNDAIVDFLAGFFNRAYRDVPILARVRYACVLTPGGRKGSYSFRLCHGVSAIAAGAIAGVCLTRDRWQLHQALVAGDASLAQHQSDRLDRMGKDFVTDLKKRYWKTGAGDHHALRVALLYQEGASREEKIHADYEAMTARKKASEETPPASAEEVAL